MKRKFLTLLLVTFLSVLSRANDHYYLDNIKGNDKNDGKTRNTAWSSLSKLGSIVFKPGDRIFLKRGQVFKGTIHLKGSGVPGSPILLSAYGSGNRPVINADGQESAIKIMDDDHWQIRNIETTGGDKAGIYIGCTKDGLALEDFRIINCYVHDIGDTSKLHWDFSKSSGGIIVVNGTFDNTGMPAFYNSVFNNVVIDDCIVRYNYRWTCISISSGKKDGKGGRGNFIRNCIAEFSAADAIRMNGVRDSYIEFCVMFRNGAWPKFPGRNLGGLGAWFFDAENCTIQYSEASWVQAATTDGGAFDIDYWQKNSTVQYCYGHHCSGYGVSVFGADPTFPTVNSVARYNIFTNNGRDSAFAFQGDFFVFTWNGGVLDGVKIHDNLSIWRPATSAPSLKHDAAYTGNNPNTFTNNIIYADTPWLVYSRNDTLKIDSNTYWSNKARPVWSDMNNKYYSLKDWQQARGQDAHSRYAKPAIETPAWYKYVYPGRSAIRASDNDIRPGSTAPAFSANATNTKKVSLADYLGKPVLLSFINTSNIAQLAFIRSMKRQYEEKGLKIILVNLTNAAGAAGFMKEFLPNFINDHELQNIPFIKDNGKIELAKKYIVSTEPTTFLIAKDGKVAGKWINLALPAQLAFAIENELKK